MPALSQAALYPLIDKLARPADLPIGKPLANRPQAIGQPRAAAERATTYLKGRQILATPYRGLPQSRGAPDGLPASRKTQAF